MRFRNTPNWKLESRNWWFGIRAASNDDVDRLSNVPTGNLKYIIFRKTTSVKDGQPFIEGIARFHEKVTHQEVKQLLCVTYAKNSREVESTIERFKRGGFVEVKKTRLSLKNVAKAFIRQGLERLSQLSGRVAVLLE